MRTCDPDVLDADHDPSRSHYAVNEVEECQYMISAAQFLCRGHGRKLLRCIPIQATPQACMGFGQYCPTYELWPGVRLRPHCMKQLLYRLEVETRSSK